MFSIGFAFLSVSTLFLLSQKIATVESVGETLEVGTNESRPAELARHEDEGRLLKPTVMVAVLIRNKAHVLPWFFYYLENLDYPKDRMIIWIRSDHNSDESVSMTQQWIERVQSLYHKVDFKYSDSETDYTDQESGCHWSNLRFSNVIQLRQEALDTARQLWADFLFSVDADSFLINNQTLTQLIEQRRTIVAPMMNVTANTFYSNFWCGMDERGYYVRTDDYLPYLFRFDSGCHAVAMVHSVLLINLRHADSRGLAYNPPPTDYPGPLDDIIIFAFSAKYSGVQMHLLNKDFYGLMLTPMETHNTVEQENDQFTHLKMEAIKKSSQSR